MMPARHSPADWRVASGSPPLRLTADATFCSNSWLSKRFGQEAENTAFRCRHRFGNGAVRSQDDDRQRRVLAMNRVEQCEPVDAGHLQVGHHRRGTRDGQRGERRFAAVGGAHAIPR